MTATVHQTVGVRPPRRERSAPPLRLWAAAAASAVLLFAALAAAPLFMATPLPMDADRAFYANQLAHLDRDAAMLRAKGQRPLSIVFVGTSRMKNVAFQAAQLAQSAKEAGVERPIASTFMGINWGGFERLGSAMQMLEHHRIDAVVMMPELFFEDFNYGTRVRLFFRYLQSKLWGQQYTLFGDREYYIPVCSGFDAQPEERISLGNYWITDGEALPGPKMARRAVRRLNDRGTLVIIADVPVTRAVMEKRVRLPNAGQLAQSFSKLPNVRAAQMHDPFPDRDYCDWAHMNPDHASDWQHVFFRKVAADLNNLEKAQ